MSEVLLFDVDEFGIATITLNRPEKRNAFNRDMIDRWVSALEECERRDDIQVVIITGAGDKAFCSGGDISDMGQRKHGTWTTKDYLWKAIHRIPLTLQRLDKPVIAALNGSAAGAGFDMALMCDLRFAAAGARFGETYLKVGLVPGDGGAWFLPRLVGLSKALELFWTGDLMEAEEARELGLVNRVFPASELAEQTHRFARRLASGPARATRITKRLVRQSLNTDLATSLDLVSSHMALVTRSEEHREGVRAFLEKRPADFPAARQRES